MQIFDDRFAEECIQAYVDGKIYAVEDIFNSDLTQCHHWQMNAVSLWCKWWSSREQNT